MTNFIPCVCFLTVSHPEEIYTRFVSRRAMQTLYSDKQEVTNLNMQLNTVAILPRVRRVFSVLFFFFFFFACFFCFITSSGGAFEVEPVRHGACAGGEEEGGY
jgi:hypothetical protein